MTGISHFVPSGEPCPVLFRSGLRWPLPLNVVRAHLEAATKEGDVVLHPFCHDSSVIRAAVETGRRVVAANFSPLNALFVRNEVIPPATDQLDAALVRLSNTLKVNIPLWKHVSGLYQTKCSTCQHPVVADYFIWQREKNQPVQVHCACGKCRSEGSQDVTEEDLHRLGGIEARGFHYSYVLGRLAGEGERRQEFDRELLELYTSRNLYALTVLLIKVETVFAGSEMISPLRLLLLRCLEVGSKLHTVLPEAEEKPRQSLRIPEMFLEVNIWRAFEAAASQLRQWKAPLRVSEGADPKAVSSPDLLSVQWGEGEQRPSVFIGQRSTRELASEIPPESITLILARAPAFELAYGALSYLWSGWLLGKPAAARMRARMWHRFPDWRWYAGAMGASLGTLSRTLTPEKGRVVLIYRSRARAQTEALLLAAGKAGLRAENLVLDKRSGGGGQGGWDHRLTLARDPEKRRAFVDSEALAVATKDAIFDGMARVLRARGEPVGEHRLRCAIWQRLSESGLLGAEVGEEGSLVSLSFVQEQVETALTGGLAEGSLGAVRHEEEGRILWMASVDRRTSLSDRVEEAVRGVLLESPSQERQSMVEALYRRFPDLLTPSSDLIGVCLASYGRALLGGRYALRDDDRPLRLGRELIQVMDALTLLGEMLGFGAHVEGLPFVVLWKGADGQTMWGFHWLPSAMLGDVLSAEVPSVPHRVLVIPSRRVELVDYKLARSQVLRDSIGQGGWRLLQTKYLWALADHDDARFGDFSASLGLHPPVERDREQLVLF